MTAVAGGTSTSFSYLPVQLSLRFEDCNLTTAPIKSIHKLLSKPPSPSSEDGYLCEPTILKELSLRSSALYPHHLEALIALLDDSAARRIDSLCLDDTTPHDAILPTSYPAVFQRMLSTALRVKTPLSNDAPDKGLRLSFDQSNYLDARLLQVIENALLQATRSVRALSLPRMEPPTLNALIRLTRLQHTPLPTATDDFELDVSCVNTNDGNIEEALFMSLAEMVTETIPRIHAATNEHVTCRLLYPDAFDDQFLTVPIRTTVSTLALYDVVSVTHHGVFQILLRDVDDHGRHLTGWVSSTAIANIRVGDRLVVGSNCTKLILDYEKHVISEQSSGRLIAAMMATTGACLRHLSLRRHPRSFPELPVCMARCPNLLELNASSDQGYYYASYRKLWSEAPPDTGSRLQVLDVSDCRLDVTALQSLTALPSLRCLQLADNKLTGDALAVVSERMRTSRALEVVNLSGTARRVLEDEAVAAVHAQMQQHLRDGYMTREARVAFLSIWSWGEAARRLPQGIAVDVFTTIFQFVGTRPRCEVWW